MVFVVIFSIYLFIYSKRCQQKQVEAAFITVSNEVGARLYFYMSVNMSTIFGGRNTYGWQAGGTHPTGMLSCLLIQIGCCDLFLEIHL